MNGNPRPKHAVFILAHNEALLSSQMAELLRDQAPKTYQTFLVINGEGVSEGNRIYAPNAAIFARGSRKADEKRIIPGNADLVLLEAFRQAQGHDSYLLIEYDVFYNGSIHALVEHVFERYAAADFAAPFVRPHKGNEAWMWWSSLVCAGVDMPLAERIYSFLQFALYSRRALEALDAAVSEGWAGHHEVLHASLFKHLGLRVAALQQDDVLRFDVNTFRAIPPRLVGPRGHLHHPVKDLTAEGLAHQVALSQTVRSVDERRASARVVLAEVLRLTGARSLVDVGCGLGIWLETAKSLDIADVLGVDGPWLERLPLYVGKEEIVLHDLRAPLDLGRRFDVCLCLEVAQQIEGGSVEPLLDTLAAASDVVVFSAAIPFQGGHRQPNEQWPSFWAERFAERGYRAIDALRPVLWSNKGVQWWTRQNTLVFARPGAAERSPGLAAAASAGPLDIVHPDFFVERARPAG